MLGKKQEKKIIPVLPCMTKGLRFSSFFRENKRFSGIPYGKTEFILNNIEQTIRYKMSCFPENRITWCNQVNFMDVYAVVMLYFARAIIPWTLHTCLSRSLSIPSFLRSVHSVISAVCWAEIQRGHSKTLHLPGSPSPTKDLEDDELPRG